MMVDDEPLIRKIVKMEMNERGAEVERHAAGDLNTERRHVTMVDTFASGPALMAALEQTEIPDYVLVDMEFQGEPTGGLLITRRLHERYPAVRIIIFSGRFDNPLSHEEDRQHRMAEIGGVVMEALRLGASAFVSKNATGGFSVENILRAIECLERGEECYFNYPVMLTLKEAAERYFAMLPGGSEGVMLSDTERSLLLLEAAGHTASEISDRLGEGEKAIQERQKELSRRLGIVNKSASRVAKALVLGLIRAGDVQFIARS
ncbi:MAG: response regulator transcription factor [Bacteroidales bacterium]|nr:response regulator transcription factor [Bacteroidales bacterium]